MTTRKPPFWGKTCSRRIAALMSRHEDRWVRVLQISQRVTILVDLESVGEPTECVVCGRKVHRVFDTCSTQHNQLNEPYCREHHPNSLAKWQK